MGAINEFAKTILDTYHDGKEEFWSAAMAPFLSGNNVLKFLKHRKVGMGLLSLFKAMDDDCKKLLKECFCAEGIDITQWKSLKAKDEYFRDAWPIYAFLAVWMDEHGALEPLIHFPDILRAVTFGIAGYGILDVLVDGDEFSPLELLSAQTLVAEYETNILRAFGVSDVNFGLLHRIRDQFLRAEIKEKSLRYKSSPYRLDFPEECGSKAAHLLTPFMLSLEALGKAELINIYFDVFMKFGAVIQILDDLKDLENDLAIGHYSFVTLDSDAVKLHLQGRMPHEIAKSLLQDANRLQRIYIICKKLINDSNELLSKLDDSLLKRIVTVTELRLDAFFKKELKLSL